MDRGHGRARSQIDPRAAKSFRQVVDEERRVDPALPGDHEARPRGVAEQRFVCAYLGGAQQRLGRSADTGGRHAHDPRVLLGRRVSIAMHDEKPVASCVTTDADLGQPVIRRGHASRKLRERVDAAVVRRPWYSHGQTA